MTSQEQKLTWSEFWAANQSRRAIRSFNSTPIPEAEIMRLLAESTLAPSSGNLQPYELHWIRSATMKTAVAQACNGQKAAASASDLVVVVASTAFARRTAVAQLAYVEASTAFGPESKAYYRKQMGKFQKILGIGSSLLWSPLLFLATLINPVLSLLPIGPIGGRHWAARNATFVSQTLMLAAAAKGIDTCPMEGFSASKVAKLLRLPRGTVVPLVIALGYRAEDARVEDRWRLPLTDIVKQH